MNKIDCPGCGEDLENILSQIDMGKELAERASEIARLRRALEEIVEIDASIADCPCCGIAAAALDGES